MEKTIGYLSEAHAAGEWIGLTTNGTVAPEGYAFFEEGAGLIVALRFPDLKHKLGQAIMSRGNHAYAWPEYRVVTIPFKSEWSHSCMPGLIERSAQEVTKLLDKHGITQLYVPESCYGGIGIPCVGRWLTLLWDDRVVLMAHPGKRNNIIPGNCPFECSSCFDCRDEEDRRRER